MDRMGPSFWGRQWVPLLQSLIHQPPTENAHRPLLKKATTRGSLHTGYPTLYSETLLPWPEHTQKGSGSLTQSNYWCVKLEAYEVPPHRALPQTTSPFQKNHKEISFLTYKMNICTSHMLAHWPFTSYVYSLSRAMHTSKTTPRRKNYISYIVKCF